MNTCSSEQVIAITSNTYLPAVEQGAFLGFMVAAMFVMFFKLIKGRHG